MHGQIAMTKEIDGFRVHLTKGPFPRIYVTNPGECDRIVAKFEVTSSETPFNDVNETVISLLKSTLAGDNSKDRLLADSVRHCVYLTVDLKADLRFLVPTEQRGKSC